MTKEEIQAKIESSQKRKHQPVKPSISVKTIIDKIRSFGYKTKIIHCRYFGKRLLKNADIRVLVKAAKIMGEGDVSDLVSTRGGLTSVEVWNPLNYRTYKGESNCSLVDPFMYSKGTRISLYRSLKEIPEKELQEFRKELEKMYLKYRIQIKENNVWVDYEHPDCSPVEDKVIAEDQAKIVGHETNKETRVISVFE